jgi:methylenetetrahydrofolate reductase (NADPH)
LAEVTPPVTADAESVRRVAAGYAGKVHALGVSDNRDQARMSALAAASLVAGEGIEPLLHVVTRDRNRVALQSKCLGALALGIGNVLCTSGTHQTLGEFAAARNVFDIDSVQLLQLYDDLGTNGSLCLGATAAPYGDPMELQVMRLSKKVAAGARFLITQPIFELERFHAWWKEVLKRDLQEIAIIAGVRLLLDGSEAKAYAEQRPRPMVPDALLNRLASKPDKVAQRAEGIQIAVETIQRLSEVDGLRGFEIVGGGDDEAVLEVIEKSRLGVD